MRQRGAPGPCGPTQGVTAEYPGLPPTACPEEPAVCPVEIQEGGTLEPLMPHQVQMIPDTIKMFWALLYKKK